jgi:hypothetical protein
MTYPHIRRHYLKEELAEHFSIEAEDYELLKTIRKSEARYGDFKLDLNKPSFLANTKNS